MPPVVTSLWVKCSHNSHLHATRGQNVVQNQPLVQNQFSPQLHGNSSQLQLQWTVKSQMHPRINCSLAKHDRMLEASVGYGGKAEDNQNQAAEIRLCWCIHVRHVARTNWWMTNEQIGWANCLHFFLRLSMGFCPFHLLPPHTTAVICLLLCSNESLMPPVSVNEQCVGGTTYYAEGLITAVFAGRVTNAEWFTRKKWRN